MLFGNVELIDDPQRNYPKPGNNLCFTMPYFFDGAGKWNL